MQGLTQALQRKEERTIVIEARVLASPVPILTLLHRYHASNHMGHLRWSVETFQHSATNH